MGLNSFLMFESRRGENKRPNSHCKYSSTNSFSLLYQNLCLSKNFNQNDWLIFFSMHTIPFGPSDSGLWLDCIENTANPMKANIRNLSIILKFEFSFQVNSRFFNKLFCEIFFFKLNFQLNTVSNI
jgi:hypothetical protein